jgi:hypothetical protein
MALALGRVPIHCWTVLDGGESNRRLFSGQVSFDWQTANRYKSLILSTFLFDWITNWVIGEQPMFDPENVERRTPKPISLEVGCAVGMELLPDGYWVSASDYDALLDLYRALVDDATTLYWAGRENGGQATPSLPPVEDRRNR